MKRFLIFLLTAFVICISACAKYPSNYSAVKLIKSNTKKEFSASFEKLDGTLTGKIQADGTRDGSIYCKATIEQGELTVYYDCGFDKMLLFSLQEGESIDDSLGYYSNSARVYIIVETVGACKGDFQISVEEFE